MGNKETAAVVATETLRFAELPPPDPKNTQLLYIYANLSDSGGIGARVNANCWTNCKYPGRIERIEKTPDGTVCITVRKGGITGNSFVRYYISGNYNAIENDEELAAELQNLRNERHGVVQAEEARRVAEAKLAADKAAKEKAA